MAQPQPSPRDSDVELELDGKVVGRVTSAARDNGRVVALAYVRREVSDDAELRWATRSHESPTLDRAGGVRQTPGVRQVRAFREYGHPLLLIGMWVLLQASTFVWAAVAHGEPRFAFTMQNILIAAIFVAFFAAGSRVAWWLAIFVNTSGVAIALGAAVFLPSWKPVGVGVLQAASLWLIWSGNVELYAQQRQRRRLAAEGPIDTGT
jgi:hypothetical protein